jgi:hypothetical protein
MMDIPDVENKLIFNEMVMGRSLTETDDIERIRDLSLREIKVMVIPCNPNSLVYLI